ncbi:MAG: ABC transporter substrate-binding protein [Tissierellales bacterium]|nr:ABC transporter substrate-binding protein [Tissierellales bacterium]MBN2826924.1 ABC transporter substrate-binding protein [Tissierellales bacterium]
MRKLKIGVSIMLILVMVFSLSACGGASQETTPAETSGQSGETQAPESTEPVGEQMSSKDALIVAIDREPASLDPSGNSVAMKRMMENSIYDTLLKFDENLTPIPCVAESWEQLDELTWQFNIRQGIKFHNGDELKASDVVFSFKRLADIATGQTNVAMFDLDALEAPDDYTVIIKTLEPYAFLEAQLCNQGMNIVSEKVVTAAGEAYGREPIGSGPFKFVSWTAGDNIVIERNDDYWGDKSILKTITFRIITESASRTIDLESGGVDMNLALSTNDAERIDQNEATQLFKNTTTNIRYLAFNTQQEIFKDKRVRQAISHATDVDIIREVVYTNEYSAPAITPVAPGLPGRNENLPLYEYDIEKAKQLLAEAGYPDGIEVEFMYLANSSNNMLAEMLIDMWKDAGITLILKPTESATLTSALNNGEHQLCSAGTSFALIDPGDGLYRFFHTDNMNSSTSRSKLSNPEIDALLDQIIVTTDAEARNKMVEEVQVLIHEEAPFVYLAHPMGLIGADSKIRGFKTLVTSMFDFEYVYFVE